MTPTPTPALRAAMADQRTESDIALDTAVERMLPATLAALTDDERCLLAEMPRRVCQHCGYAWRADHAEFCPDCHEAFTAEQVEELRAIVEHPDPKGN